jgi:hypothetical protein
MPLRTDAANRTRGAGEARLVLRVVFARRLPGGVMKDGETSFEPPAPEKAASGTTSFTGGIGCLAAREGFIERSGRGVGAAFVRWNIALGA